MAEEERRAGVIKAELGMLREVLLPRISIKRKKRAAVKRGGDNLIKGERMTLCPEISPDLLGPLMVDQSSTTMDKVGLKPCVSSVRSSLHSHATILVQQQHAAKPLLRFHSFQHHSVTKVPLKCKNITNETQGYSMSTRAMGW